MHAHAARYNLKWNAARYQDNECPLFGKVCTPANPVGPCMVSTEGSCSAYFKYGLY